MTLSGDTRASSSSSAGGLAQQHYHKVLELEKLLVTTIQSKGPFDPNVRILRSNIRELFEAIILEDHEFADLHDVEQSLWRLHHTRIEEFRSRIRKSMPPAGTASPPAPGNKPIVRREPVHKILAVFRSFLSEATGFYHDLILKIRAKHGLSQDDLTYSTINGKDVKDDDKRIVELKRCQVSCHRCLIYLGDLSRYKEYYGDGDVKNRDWSIAAGFYVKAASLWPASGNPYNQLAVLATYIGDEMLAVYHYFRSLASESPFLTAKDNLVLLFEKNRHSYLRLIALAGKPSQAGKLEPVTKGKMKSDTGSSQPMGDESSAVRQLDLPNSEQKGVAVDMMKSFRVRVVRLNGILFTRTSLETFAEVHSCVLSELEELLNVRETDEDAVPSQGSLTSGRIWGTGPNVLLQLISILIFSVHNIIVGPGPDSHQPTYAEILQRSVVLAHAFIATFECVGYLVRHCAKMDDPSNSLLLPAIVVVMEWLSCRPEIAVGTEVKEKEGNARMFFWKNCVNLLNKLEIGGLAANEDNEGLILWEDFELWGFTPLLPIQHKLDYTKKPAMGLGSLKERHARVGRLKHAGKVISDMFEGLDKGMHYDVETDIFYLTGDKKRQERKQVDVVLTAETLKESPVCSVRESEDYQAVAEPDSVLTKVAVSVDEDDEEVIVFKPSNMLKESTDTFLLDDASLFQGKIDTNSNFASNTSQPDSRGSSTSMLVSETKSQFIGIGAAPSMVPPSSSSLAFSTENSNVQAVVSEPVSVAPEVPGSSKDFNSFFAVSSSGLDSIPERMDHFYGPSLNKLGLQDGSFKASVSEYETGVLSGPIVDWGIGTGFGMFQNPPSHNFIPTSVNWQPQGVQGGSSMWNSELHKLAVARGSYVVAPSSSTMGMAKRSPLIDSSPGSMQSMALTSAMPNSSESLGMPAHSMGSNVVDLLVQTKPSFQEPKLTTTDSNLGPLQAATQDLSISAAKWKPESGLMSDSDKPARRTGNFPSSMRPPPGFGPLPVKPPVSLSATSLFQASQPASSGHPASTMVQQKIASDHSGASSVDEHVDDYAWLDGYTPPKRETSQSAASGHGRIVGSSNYGWPAGVFNPALDATTSPFPGMKPSDRFLSPPPLPASAQQPPLPQAFLQQELLRKQQTQEQFQQQLLQEHQRQQLQQLYNAQLAAQRNHQLQHVEQQQPQPSLQQQPLALQQQMPQPLWPGQNSFVS